MASDTLEHIPLSSEAELKQKTLELIDAGFRISSQSPELVTLERKQRAITGSMVATAILLLVLCVIPGVVYIWVKIVQAFRVETVVLRVDPVAAAAQRQAAAVATEITWSEDRKWWWDGTEWRSAANELPPAATATGAAEWAAPQISPAPLVDEPE
ncbi:MAG: hypothetical protein RJA49_339 [Actinomycetota bacterium]